VEFIEGSGKSLASERGNLRRVIKGRQAHAKEGGRDHPGVCEKNIIGTKGWGGEGPLSNFREKIDNLA